MNLGVTENGEMWFESNFDTELLMNYLNNVISVKVNTLHLLAYVCNDIPIEDESEIEL